MINQISNHSKLKNNTVRREKKERKSEKDEVSSEKNKT